MGLTYEELGLRLGLAADEIAAGRLAQARSALEALHAQLAPDGPSWHFDGAIFAQALSLCAGQRPPSINLYLRDLDLSQISLFNLLARHLPIISLAGGLANELLAGFVAGREEATLLDLGIGTAQQEMLLLRTLAERDALPGRLHVVGVEPSRTSLQESEASLARLGRELGMELDFVGVHGLAEDLSDQDWADLPVGGGELVVNAAFAAHHIQSTGDGPAAARRAVFGRLRELDPTGFVLVEPNSDHLEPDWRQRFDNAWRHYGTVLRLIDAVDAPHADAVAMKTFFAREVEDVIANAETTRAERHELTGRWIERLEATGFSPIGDLPALAVDDAVVGLYEGPGHRSVGFAGEPLVAVLCAARDAALAEVGWVATRSDDHVVAGSGSTVGRSAATALRVHDVMDRSTPTISLGSTLSEAAAVLHQSQAADLAVLDDDQRFVGVLSEGDVLRLMMPSGGTAAESLVEAFELLEINGRVQGPRRMDDLVIRDPVTLSPDDDLLRVADIMTDRMIRRLPVVDADGTLVGTVSRADLCHALLAGGVA